MLARHLTIQTLFWLRKGGDSVGVDAHGYGQAGNILEIVPPDDPAWRLRAPRSWRRERMNYPDFLVNVLARRERGGAEVRRPGDVSHGSCHTCGGLGLLTEPERLLRRVKDLAYVPLERADECCGFGGSFSVRFPEISGAMVRDKAAFIEKAGVDVVTATDAGCLMNIAGCLRRRGSAVRAMHLAEVLEKT